VKQKTKNEKRKWKS